MQILLNIPNELNDLLNGINGSKELFIINKITKELRIIRGDSFTLDEIKALDFTKDELNRIGFTKEEIEDIEEGIDDFKDGKYITNREANKVFNNIENGIFK